MHASCNVCVHVGVVLTAIVYFFRRIAEMAVDPAFKGAGKKEGLEIFRIEVSDTVCMSHVM